MSVSVQCEHLHTILCIRFFVGVCIGLGIGSVNAPLEVLFLHVNIIVISH